MGGMGLGVCSVCNSNCYCQCISFVNILSPTVSHYGRESVCVRALGGCVVMDGMGLGVCSVCNSNWSYCQCIPLSSFLSLTVKHFKQMFVCVSVRGVGSEIHLSIGTCIYHVFFLWGQNRSPHMQNA